MDSFENNQFLPELRYEYTNGRKALNQMSEIISRTTKTLESVFDHDWIHILVENPFFFDILTNFKIKQKGITVRFITTITPENITNCTKLMKFVELRHTDAIIGYLGISDRKQFINYIRPFSRQENNNNNNKEESNNNNLQLLNFIHITNKDFIQMQYIFFEKLWESSIPANEKIAEIKRIMYDNSSLLNTNIRDVYIIKKTIPKVIQSAVEEILLFFPTINSFWLIEESNEIIGLLSEAIDRYIKVKIIIHIDDGQDSYANKTIDQKIKKANKVLGTYVNYTTKKIDAKTVILIADQAISLSISIKDHDGKNTFNDAIEMASFSNNELNISTLLSFFESLWIRLEIEKQNIIKQTYFKIFKEPQLRDESYRRKWFFERTKNN
ncbi:MAG TPA: hypothetical protein VFP49_10285 [Nitrososphaeraceae archaeon]|nr:hypothetical protein [Nitrososphaeraceae archaeon]